MKHNPVEQQYFHGNKYLLVVKHFLVKRLAESCQPKLLDVSSAVGQLGQITKRDGIKYQIKSCSSGAM